MFRSQARPSSPTRQAPIQFRDSIEWEEVAVPGAVVKAAATAAFIPSARMPLAALAEAGSAWSNTLPAYLADAVPSPVATFTEPLEGLAVREMNEPDVFQHFFGN